MPPGTRPHLNREGESGDDLQGARRSDRGQRDRFPPSRRSEVQPFRAFRAARWRLERPEFKPLGFQPREFPDPGTCDEIPRFPAVPAIESSCSGRIVSNQITNGNLNAAKGALINIIGRIREAQIALRLQKNGAEIMQLGKKVKDSAASDALTDIDVIAREGSQVFFSQVKAASALAFGKGSTRWDKFTSQVDATLDFASKNGGKVRYYVDEISDDVLKYLHDRGIEVTRNAEFLQ
ncbi:MAG TPA: hypothetical protein VNA24_26085 [Hyalangium sp.]|nr:hypothetical protein [Hyalangium sp.]